MEKTKKRLFWVIGFFGIILVFTFGCILFLPKIINLDPVKDKIIAEFTRRTGLSMSVQHAGLILFPRPKIVASQVKMEVPENASGTVKTLGMVLSINLFSKRKVDLSSLEIEAPDVTFHLQKETKQDKPSAFTLAQIDETILSLLTLTARIPGATDIRVKVVNGCLRLFNNQDAGPWFSDIQGILDLGTDNLRMDITCASSLWGKMDVSSTVNRKEAKASGQIDLTDCMPQKIIDFFMPNAGFRIETSGLNLTTDFTTDALNGLSFGFKSNLSSLGIDFHQKKIQAKGIGLKGNVNILAGDAHISIDNLAFNYPGLTLSGNLNVHKNSPRIGLSLEGNNIEVDSVRKEMLTFFEDQDKVQKVFAVLRDGYIPAMTISARADSLAEIRKLDSWIIKVHMINGNIFIPKADLDLKTVTGDVVIAERVLTGDNLSATLDDTRGYGGKLTLGFPVKNAPFHLDIALEADLSQLPPILKKFVKHKGFIREIDLISAFEGRAKGKLILGENTSRIRPRVEVDGFQATGKYGRIPFPVTLSGNRFQYFGKTISLEKVKGKIGDSSFSGLSGTIDWTREPELHVTSGQAGIDIDEVYPWLASYDKFPLSKSAVKRMGGRINVNRAKITGPIGRLQDFTYDIAGDVIGLTGFHPSIEGPIQIQKGSFLLFEDGRSQQLTLKDARVAVLDASMEVSGDLTEWERGIRSDIQLNGNLGHISNQWISEIIHLPAELTLCSPLTVSRGKLVYHHGAGVSFKGLITIQNGPEISLGVHRDPEKFKLEDLSIKDTESQAVLNITSQKNALDLNYSGFMSPGTVNRLFAKNNKPRGQIEGDFHIHMPLDHPWQSSVEGKLLGRGLFIPRRNKLPVDLIDFDISAGDNRLNVQSARLTWRQHVLDLKGEAVFSTDKLSLNMDLLTGELDWEEIKQDFGKLQNFFTERRTDDRQAFPLDGMLNIKADSMTLVPYTWYPFHTEIFFGNGDVEINVKQANLCSIATAGVIRINHEDVSLDFKLDAEDRQLSPILGCFFNKETAMNGRFSLKGVITGRGKGDHFDQHTQGTIELSAIDGRIFSDSVLAQILTYLNVTEGLWGKLPSIGQEGIGYHSITVKGVIQNGVLKVTEGVMDGDAMEIVGLGKVDIANRQLDIVLLLAPLKTIDRIVKRIPIVGRILGGSLVSIPVKVTGEVTNPKITTLAPSEIGAGMIRMLERIVQFPIDIFHSAQKSQAGNASEGILKND